jgi:hypothetical protein
MNDQLKEGLNVVSSDGDRMGEIDNVYLDPEENRAIYIKLTPNNNAKRAQLVPAAYVREILGNKVLLSAKTSALDGLPSFKS